MLTLSKTNFHDQLKSKAIFLDRDGVINHDPGDYTKSLNEFTVLPTVYEALEKMQELDFLLILITNQGGVPKGLYSIDDVEEIHNYFKMECENRGIKITDIYYSPHHDDYSRSLTRKPDSLMIERAIGKYNIDPSTSYMIGDKQRDIDCGNKAGVPGILIPPNAPLINYVELLV